jgi:hypothetical protein
MAQSTSKSSQSARKRNSSSSGNGSAPKARPRSSSGGRATAAKGNRSSGAKRASGGQRRRAPQSKGAIESARDAVANGAQSTKDTVADGAQSAGQAIGSVAGKAKVPAAAGGAALAGLVGGMAIAARAGGRRRLLGVPVPGTRRPLVKIKAPRRKAGSKDLVRAAGHMGTAGRQMAELASEVRLARQQLDSGRRRSPVEVVLEGLTARRGRPR